MGGWGCGGEGCERRGMGREVEEKAEEQGVGGGGGHSVLITRRTLYEVGGCHATVDACTWLIHLSQARNGRLCRVAVGLNKM